jgi:hypothetical protein
MKTPQRVCFSFINCDDGVFFRVPQIRAANFIHLGSKNYYFGQQVLLAKAADFTGIGSNFC